jgi:hypothetical protein
MRLPAFLIIVVIACTATAFAALEIASPKLCHADTVRSYADASKMLDQGRKHLVECENGNRAACKEHRRAHGEIMSNLQCFMNALDADFKSGEADEAELRRASSALANFLTEHYRYEASSIAEGHGQTN